MLRRHFLTATTGLCASSSLVQALQFDSGPTRRVGVIGHTGRGNYGHGLDTVWLKIPSARIVGLADANPAGLIAETIKLQLKPEQAFNSYQEMLKETKPEFVSICPRHVDQHADMILAATAAGVRGIYIEKPFCQTLEQADRIAGACEKSGTTIAIAHRNRYHPTMDVIRWMIESGEIGRVLELRGKGKGDRRGGAEDFWVLGTHVLNLFQLLAGEPVSCSALMKNKGHLVTAADVIEGPEGLGKIAGDELHTRYEFDSGIVGYYDSMANDETSPHGYCMQIIGSKGTIIIHIDAEPLAHLIPGNPYQTGLSPRKWIPITTAGLGKPEHQPELIEKVHNHVLAVQDLIDACDKQRAPLCDLQQGIRVVEMIHAAFESHRQNGARISFPLTERGNPLLKL